MHQYFKKPIREIKKMKPLILIGFCIGISCNIIIAQTSEDYEALNSYLPSEKLQYLEQQPELYAQLAYLNRNGYYAGNVGEKDVSMLPETSEVEVLYPNLPEIGLALIENRELNLLGYMFDTHPTEFRFYRISNTDKVLVIPPTEMTFEKMNQE